jgi:hypothetical protein
LHRLKAAFLSGAGSFARFSRKYSTMAAFVSPASGADVLRTYFRGMAAWARVQVSLPGGKRAQWRSGARVARTVSGGP